MLSGVVMISLAGGDLHLDGDANSNSIMLQADPATPTTFVVTGLNSTTLHFGAVDVPSPFSISNVSHDVDVSLGDGTDTFDFEGPAAGGGNSTVLGTLNITSGNGIATNTLHNVTAPAIVINNGTGSANNMLTNVTVSAVDLNIHNGQGENTATLTNVTVDIGNFISGGGTGNRTTTISNSKFEGTATINGANGASTITINNTYFDANLGGPALTVSTTASGPAESTFTVQDAPGGHATTFGAGPFVKNVALNDQLIINNTGAGAGGTVTQLTGPNAASPVVVYGNIRLSNAPNSSAAKYDIFSLANADVVGGVTIINNGESSTQTFITNSKIGTQLTAGTPAPLLLNNSRGADLFSMSGTSSVPWGISIDNDTADNGAMMFGSTTQVSAGASIGTRPLGVAHPSGFGLILSGDSAVDVVSITGATIGGGLNVGTAAGNRGLGAGATR